MKYRPAPLSPEVEALLAHEREIPLQADVVRRRAELRARTALWHARSKPTWTLGAWFRQFRLVVASFLVTSLGFAAWVALDPSPEAVSPSPSTVDGRAKPASLATTHGDRAAIEAPQEVRPALSEKAEASVNEAARSSPQQPKVPAKSASAVVSRLAASPTHVAAPTVQELEALEAARQAVARAHFQRALSLLRSHERRFPTSQLDEERAALRIRALQGAGQNEQARQAAKTFDERHPDSVLAPTLRGETREKE